MFFCVWKHHIIFCLSFIIINIHTITHFVFKIEFSNDQRYVIICLHFNCFSFKKFIATDLLFGGYSLYSE